MKIPICESKVHKQIIVKARCCSDCGQVSEWVKKQYFIACRIGSVRLLENPDTLHFDVILSANKEKCQEIVYTTNGADPTTASPKYTNGIKIAVCNKNGRTVKIKSRLVCRETGQMGEITEKTYKVPKVQVIALGDKILGLNNNPLGQIGGV